MKYLLLKKKVCAKMVLEEGSILDNKSSNIHGHELTVRQQIILYFIIPSVCFSVLYVLNFSLDVGVAMKLTYEGKIVSAFMTISLVYLPALVCYFVQLSKLPNLMETNAVICWCMKEIGWFVTAAFRIIACMSERLFWTVELISGRGDQEEAMHGCEGSLTELARTYIYLQIFLQNIPQAMLQFYLLIKHVSHEYSTDKIQDLSAVVSLLMAAAGVTTFHRYESQRLGGRVPIWHPSTCNLTVNQNTPPSTPTEAPIELQTNRKELVLPVRKPRLKTLEEDNPAGKVLLFVFWFLFLLGRTLTLTTAFTFYPYPVIGVVMSHVLIMFVYYLQYPISIYRKVFLSITSVFFIIEVGFKINKMSFLYFLFIVTTLVEDTALSLLWFIWANWEGWWYNYISYVNINAHLAQYVIFALYLAFFKPQIKYIKT